MADRRRPRSEDSGFTLVEVMVALFLLGLVSAAAVPVLVLSQKTSADNRDRTLAKGLAQQELETLRSLGFYVALQNQGASADVDLLDSRYPGTTLSTGPTASGLVPAGAARLADEPATGAFYRTWTAALPAPHTRFSSRVALQFLRPSTDGSTYTSVAPATTYDSNVQGRDVPPTRLAGVTVTLLWPVGAATKSYRLTSQLAGTDVTPGSSGATGASGQLLSGQASAQAVRVTFTDNSNSNEIFVNAGTAAADGASTGSTSSSSGSSEGASLGVSGASNFPGAASSVGAPAGGQSTVTSAATSMGPRFVGSDQCVLLCFGGTTVDGLSASVAGGLPVVGSGTAPGAGSPVVGRVVRSGCGSTCTRLQKGMAVSGYPNAVDNNGLKLNYPYTGGMGLVTLGDAPAGEDDARGEAAVEATAGASGSVTAVAKATTQVLDVVRTDFIATGLVQVRLTSASLTCRAGTSAPSATAVYSGVVRYARRTGSSYPYTDVPFSYSGTTLASSVTSPVPLGAGLDGMLTQGSYFANVEVAAKPEVTVDTTTRTVRASLDVVKVATTAFDNSNGWNVTVGSLSCTAQDAR